MKLRFLGLLSLAIAVCLSSALVAQDQQQRGQRGQRGQGGPPGGGRGGFGGFGGFGGGAQIGGALELLGLLRMEEVRKEVEMSDETYMAVRDAQPDMREIFQASEEERTAKLKEANEKAQELLDEVLSPAHQKRLMGLLVQQDGRRAATNDLIAKEIGLDEAGRKKVVDALAKASEGMREKMREAFQGGGQGGFDREKMTALMEESRKEQEKAVDDVLSDSQEKALEALKGEKFEFPENRGFGGRGGPGGGGRPGGRPAGGNDNN